MHNKNYLLREIVTGDVYTQNSCQLRSQRAKGIKLSYIPKLPLFLKGGNFIYLYYPWRAKRLTTPVGPADWKVLLVILLKLLGMALSYPTLYARGAGGGIDTQMETAFYMYRLALQ